MGARWRRRDAFAVGRTRLSGALRRANRSTERAPDDVHDLLDVDIGLATLGRGPDAATNVILEDQDRERVDGRAERGGLLEDVHAVLVALDHAGDAANLALDP